jgi:hypothetical protein
MNYRIIIHAMIIIFIIHIIIINLDYEINIGVKEKFNNKSNKNKSKENFSDSKNDKSLDFLLENKDNDSDFIKKMNQLSDSIEKPNPLNAEKDIIPANGYLSDNNTPNFPSNVNDTSKFYKVQNNYDSLNENQLQSTSLDQLNQKYNNIATEINKVENTVRTSTEKPTTWEYNNEFPMNGGTMNGIVGFDSLESSYSNFGNPIQLKPNEKPEYENIPHDDLRKPVVFN